MNLGHVSREKQIDWEEYRAAIASVLNKISERAKGYETTQRASTEIRLYMTVGELRALRRFASTFYNE